MVTDAQKKATAKYESENYDKVLLRMPKGERDKIKAFIKSIRPDESLNEFINKAVDERMKQIQQSHE